MRIKEAIAKADALRKNALTEEQKAEWLQQLELQLAEMLGKEPQAERWPADYELLMPAPHDRIYVLYLVAQIDYYNQETALYANDMAIYNAAVSEALAWWRRSNCPAKTQHWGVW